MGLRPKHLPHQKVLNCKNRIHVLIIAYLLSFPTVSPLFFAVAIVTYLLPVALGGVAR